MFVSERVFTRIMNFLKAFFKAAPGSIKGAINLDELCRIVVLAILAHQGVLATLSAVGAHASSVFVNPGDAAMYTAYLAAVVETVRRFSHGSPADPPPTMKPS